MKKFIFVKTNENVEMGDVVTIEAAVDSPFGEIAVNKDVTINDETLKKFIELGEIKEVNEIPMDLDYYINKISYRIGTSSSTVYAIFNEILNIFPAAVLSILLKEIAIEIDNKYNDHIKNSPEIYAVNLINGKIGAINKTNIKNYKNFAAFRSIDDAKIACKIVKSLLKKLFSNE